MKKALFTPLFVAALFLIPAGAFASPILQQTVGNTLVSINARGADTEVLTALDTASVSTLADFAATYNKIVAENNLSADQVRAELTAAANQALAQRSLSTDCQHKVEVAAVTGSDTPALKMIIYPQTYLGYRYEVSFSPVI